MKDLDKLINEAINETFKKEEESNVINEAYVTQPTKFDLQTELLSDKTKRAHQELLEGYSKKLNEVSAKLDGCDKSGANLNNSEFRSLKIDEAYNHNASFLHGMYFENISDLNSQINMSSLSYMKLTRDFGTFDAWQEDFVACCLSARNGWAVTFYNPYLKRYMNTVIDLHSQNVMIGMIPVVVIDCWEHSYYRDYLKNRKAYVFGMMKELNWHVIEDRIKKTEKLSKIL
jgi:Fe-Mn family superoxide dismutase